MLKKRIIRLHWKIFFPLVGLLWLIIGITIVYFVSHERKLLKSDLESRLVNVNNTVIEAYENGADLQRMVNFIKLYTGRTTLAPLRITVYDDDGKIVADNEETTIYLHDKDGNVIPELKDRWKETGIISVRDVALDNAEYMLSTRASDDGKIHTFAALPYNGEVHEFLSTDPTIWVIVIGLGLLSSLVAYMSARAISRNIYALRDFAAAISSDHMPDNVGTWDFSKDELGDVSRNLLTLYRDKLRAEQEKSHHERRTAIMVSHELNTPVGIIKGCIDTIVADKDMPEKQRHNFMLRAQQNTRRLTQLVSDLNTAMRLRDTNYAADCRAIDLHALCESIANEIHGGHIADGIEFKSEIPMNCRVIACEPLLHNALMHLVRNSAQHSGASQMVIRPVDRGGGRYRFSFEDNGCGVGEEHIDKLFDLFYRVDEGRSRRNGGTGLGLSLVNSSITSMKGDITVANAHPSGLRFIISLPSPEDNDMPYT